MKDVKELKLLSMDKLVSLSDTDLKKELSRSAKNLFVLRMKKQTWELKQTHVIKFLRRYIARLNTVANSSMN